MRARLLPVLAAAALAAPGCSLLPDAPENEFEGKTAAQLYAMGQRFRAGGDFSKAIEAFNYLEASYPFDPYAQQGMLETAYSHYRRDEHEEAIAVLERFAKQNPVHTDIAYAQYLRGIVYFDYGKSLLHYVLPYVRHNKDPTPWFSAFESFSWIVENHPESRYARDARQRTIFLRNLLARYEVHVADFYLRRKAYVAVANRARYALERYHGAPEMGAMLWYQEQAYRHLEMPRLADDARRVRELNFPGYRHPSEIPEEPSWLGTAGGWISNATDYLAVTVGFDIEEFPPEDFSGRYRLAALRAEQAGAYRPAREPEKVVVSEVPSGFQPAADDAGGFFDFGFWRALGFGRPEEEPAAPPVPAPATPEPEAPETDAPGAETPAG